MSHPPPRLELLPWINPANLRWEGLLKNPAAMDYIFGLGREITKADGYFLSQNEAPEAIAYLRLHPEIINWSVLSANRAREAIELLRENPERINWFYLSYNPTAIDLLLENPNKIQYIMLSGNPAPNARDLLLKYIKTNPSMMEFIYTNPSKWAMDFIRENYRPEEYKWDDLCQNPAAIELLRENLDTYAKKMDWFNLSRNPAAMDILLKNPDKINYFGLCLNPNPTAMDILEQNQEYECSYLSENPAIFQYSLTNFKNAASAASFE
jgi:hypothetical protein